ncbi:MAG: serine/threonine protein kinase [Cyanobium sp. CZS 48M]|nr:serine/threonine protein kinase [Cyanobium sp. CZS48M]
MSAADAAIDLPALQPFLAEVETVLLPELRLHSPDPRDPVVVERLPRPWCILGTGNFAAVLLHPRHCQLVVKVYAPGRPGLAEEAEVYRRIGNHPAFSRCHHVGAGYLVLQRLLGHTLYDCVRLGILIEPQVLDDVDAAIAHAESRGLHGHDVHGRNVVQHRGRGHIVDISDFLDPTPCRAWRDLRWAYHVLYRPLIAPTGLRAPGPLLALVRRGYRVFRRLRPAGGFSSSHGHSPPAPTATRPPVGSS